MVALTFVCEGNEDFVIHSYSHFFVQNHNKTADPKLLKFVKIFTAALSIIYQLIGQTFSNSVILSTVNFYEY